LSCRPPETRNAERVAQAIYERRDILAGDDDCLIFVGPVGLGDDGVAVVVEGDLDLIL
jgi:hypothetical protein